MKRYLYEQPVIFLSVIKWVLLATLIGAVVGVTTALFVRTLEWATGLSSGNYYYFLLLPLILPLNALLLYRVRPDDSVGTDHVIDSIHSLKGISIISILKGFFTPVLTIASGGSAGKESPCADVGAGMASVLARIFSFSDEDRRKLMICGISAAFAAVFGTPLGGAMFGVEVLFVGSILYEILLPSVIAGITGFQVAAYFGVTYFSQALPSIAPLTQRMLIETIVAGMFFGLCAVFMIVCMRLARKVAGPMERTTLLKAFLGGCIVAGVGLLVSPKYLGLGLNVIESALDGNPVMYYDFALKAAVTAITIALGGSGGLITPVFFVGATAGAAFAGFWGLDVASFAALGLVALLAGTVNTPIAASIIAIELFGRDIGLYASVACFVSFLIAGHLSMYPSQVLTIKKAASIQVDLGSEMSSVRPKFRRGRLLDSIDYIADAITSLGRRHK